MLIDFSRTPIMIKKFSLAEVTADPPARRGLRQTRASRGHAARAARVPDTLYTLGAGTVALIELMKLLAH